MHSICVLFVLIIARVFSVGLETHLNHCTKESEWVNFGRNELIDCPNIEKSTNPWAFLQPPDTYRNISNELSGRSCLSSIRRFVGSTAETASASAIFLNFHTTAVWIVLDNGGNLEWSSTSGLKSSNVYFRNERLTSVESNEIININQRFDDSVIQRVDYIQMDVDMDGDPDPKKCMPTRSTDLITPPTTVEETTRSEISTESVSSTNMFTTITLTTDIEENTPNGTTADISTTEYSTTTFLSTDIEEITPNETTIEYPTTISLLTDGGSNTPETTISPESTTNSLTSPDIDRLDPPLTTIPTITPSNPTSTYISPNVDRNFDSNKAVIGGLIAFVIILCLGWAIWLLAANYRRSRRRVPYKQFHTSASMIIPSLPKLMLQKSHLNGQIEIVGLNRTTSERSFTV